MKQVLARIFGRWWRGTSSPAPSFGWSAREEQEVGGLVMWIPGGTVDMIVALHRLYRWLGAPSRLRAIVR